MSYTFTLLWKSNVRNMFFPDGGQRYDGAHIQENIQPVCGGVWLLTSWHFWPSCWPYCCCWSEWGAPPLAQESLHFVPEKENKKFKPAEAQILAICVHKHLSGTDILQLWGTVNTFLVNCVQVADSDQMRLLKQWFGEWVGWYGSPATSICTLS